MRTLLPAWRGFAVIATCTLVLVLGGLALGSNMGFQITKDIVPGLPLPKGMNWISFPFNNPYGKASGVCDLLGLTSSGPNSGRCSVSRLNPASGVFTNYTCGSNTVLSFTLTAGQCLMLRCPGLIPAVIVGSHDPAAALPLAPVGGMLPKGDNWLAVPYHFVGRKADDVCEDIGLASTGPNTARGTVARLNATSGVYQAYTCGTNTALAYTLTIGECARVRTPTALSWIPSHW